MEIIRFIVANHEIYSTIMFLKDFLKSIPFRDFFFNWSSSGVNQASSNYCVTAGQSLKL